VDLVEKRLNIYSRALVHVPKNKLHSGYLRIPRKPIVHFILHFGLLNFSIGLLNKNTRRSSKHRKV
jgi:hypothetical protein